MALLDVRGFRSGKEPCIHTRPDSGIELRRASTLAHLSRCLFHPAHPGFGRGAHSFIPDQHQLLPLDTMLTPWLKDILKTPIAEGEEAVVPKHARDTVIVADEGGMGKTYAALIVAIYYYRKHGGSVIVLCPPLMKDEWFKAFSKVIGVKVRRRSAECLSESTFEEGVTIIGKHSLMRHPLKDTARDNLRQRVELCILDEGHEGMITGGTIHYNSGEEAAMKASIQDVLRHSKRRLIATATPIRKSWKDLLALLDAAIVDDDDRKRLTDFFDGWKTTQSNQWVDDLRKKWLPALDSLHRGRATQAHIDYISINTQRMIPWLSQADALLLQQRLPAALLAANGVPLDRARMARDLHPFGKYMSITLRDDLGDDKVTSLYRMKQSRVIVVPEWDELIESEKLIDRNNWGKDSWKGIVRSCPLNALNDRYASLEVDHNPNAVDLFERASASDPRYGHLKDICSETASMHAPGTRAAVVVFCTYRGTIEAVEHWGRKNGHEVFTLTNPDDPNQQSTPSPKRGPDLRKATLDKAAKSALDKSKLTLLVCGESATVGLNMPWATHAVHWDLNYGAVENIAQKTWRLDRRWDGTLDIAQDFCVTHLVLGDDTLKNTDDANQRFSANRVLLGDRRYLGQKPQPPIFTDPNHGFVADVWNQEPRNLHFSAHEVVWIWDWINCNVHDVSGTGESLWLHALCAITGLEIDLDSTIFAMKNDTDGNIGITKAELHDLITLAGPGERPSLQFLAGGYMKAADVMTSYGIPSVNSSQQLLNLLPSGQLASKFTRFLRKQPRGDVYPFVIESDNEESRRYAAHLGVLELMESPSYAHLKLLHGPECPSGLIVREGSGKWEHVATSRLEDHKQVFDTVLEFASELIYPSSVPRNDPVQGDLDEFELMDDYRGLANPLANPAALARCDLNSVIALHRHHSGLRPPRREDMLPLVNVFSPQRQQKKPLKGDGRCAVCGKDAPCGEPECKEWNRCWDLISAGWC